MDASISGREGPGIIRSRSTIRGRATPSISPDLLPLRLAVRISSPQSREGVFNEFKALWLIVDGQELGKICSSINGAGAKLRQHTKVLRPLMSRRKWVGIPTPPTAGFHALFE